MSLGGMHLSYVLEVVMSIRHVERLRGNASKRPLMLLMAGTMLLAGTMYGLHGCARDNVTTLPEIVIQASPNESDTSRTAELHSPAPNR
jgi:hypothetical protein